MEKLNRSALIMVNGLLSPVILLMTRALIPASFIKGQNGEGAGFNLELIVIIAPGQLNTATPGLIWCCRYISSNLSHTLQGRISPIREMKTLEVGKGGHVTFLK